MSDYNALVKRLRDSDTCDERGSFTPDPVAQAGADAIEALVRERREAKSLNAYIADRLNEEVRQAGSHPQVEIYTSMDEFRAALRGLGDLLLRVRLERDVRRDRVAELEAKLAAWQDPESDERQKLQEEIIFGLGDGARSEVELREGQLDATEAALELSRARVAELVRELDEARRLFTEAEERAAQIHPPKARVAELEGLIRERCKHWCADREGYSTGVPGGGRGAVSYPPRWNLKQTPENEWILTCLDVNSPRWKYRKLSAWNGLRSYAENANASLRLRAHLILVRPEAKDPLPTSWAETFRATQARASAWRTSRVTRLRSSWRRLAARLWWAWR